MTRALESPILPCVPGINLRRT